MAVPHDGDDDDDDSDDDDDDEMRMMMMMMTMTMMKMMMMTTTMIFCFPPRHELMHVHNLADGVCALTPQTSGTRAGNERETSGKRTKRAGNERETPCAQKCIQKAVFLKKQGFSSHLMILQCFC